MAWHILSIFSILRRLRRKNELLRRRRARAAARRRRLPFLLLTCLATGAPAQSQPPPDSSGFEVEHLEDYQDLWSRGEYALALGQLNEMLSTMSRGVPARYLYDRAALHFSTGRLQFAVRDMEMLCRQISAPIYTLRLAEYYRSLGKEELYARTLEDAARQAENRWFYGAYEDNVVAMARIQDLQGENPRTILRTLLDPLIEKRPDYAGGYIGAGNLALSKDDYGLAAEYFEKALTISQTNQDALSGLIRSYLDSGDARYMDVLETLRTINANHPVLLEVDSELLIRSGKYEEALSRINDGLQINPVQSRLLGLKVSALFFLDREEERLAVQQEALSVNDRNSEIFRIPGEMASSRVRITEAAEFLEQALAVNPDDEEAKALLGFALLDLGRDEEARIHLEQAFAVDPYDVRVFNVLQVLDTLENYVTLERGDFRLSLPEGEADLLAQDAFDLLDEGRRILGEKYQVEFETPIVVQMFDQHDDFMVRTMGFPGAVGYLGICTGRLITMDSPSARLPGQVNWRSVLWHEFAHVVTLQKTRNRMPRWFSEGISGFEEHLRDPAWGESAALEYKQIYAESGIPRVHHLERYFTTPRSSLYLSYGYFVSAEFVEFYVSTYGMDALNRVLEMMGEGKSTEAAIAIAADTSIDSINEGFAEHLRHRFRKFENLPEIASARGRSVSLMDAGTSVTLESQGWAEVRSPYTDAIESGVQALQKGRWKDAEIQLKRAHELYPEYQGADAPLRLLINLYDRLNREEDLREALRTQISISATDLPSYLRYAQLLEAVEDWKGVADITEKGFGIDPFDKALRQTRLKAAVALGQTTIALSQLEHLSRLDASRAADYQLRRIELLMQEGRWEQAHDEVFDLLERLPYFWDAQEALLAIVERENREAAMRGAGEDVSRAAQGP